MTLNLINESELWRNDKIKQNYIFSAKKLNRMSLFLIIKDNYDHFTIS